MARKSFLQRDDMEYNKFSRSTPVVSTESEHSRYIFDGFTYTSYYEETSLGVGADLDILLVTPSAPQFTHLQGVEITVDAGPDTMLIYEDTTVSANGTSLAANNRNRNSTRTAGLQVFHTPTVTGVGTEISSHRILGITNKSAVTHIGDVDEWVLKPDTNYLIRFSNGSGAQEDVEIHLSWHEPAYPGYNQEGT